MHRILYFDEIDSTNNYLKESAENGADDGLVISAALQTSGKGRLGRKWIAKKGENATFSVLIRKNTEGLVFRAALACVYAIKELTCADCRVKWPNDIVIEGKKVAGILCESAFSDGKPVYMIMGMGVNLNTTEFPAELPYAGSVKSITGICIEPAQFIQVFLKYFDEVLVQRLSDVLERIAGLSATLGHNVKAGEITGYAERFEDDGSLVIRDENGEHVIVVGDVSVRGLYGYV